MLTFTNANVFNGRDDSLQPVNVTVSDDRITKISGEPPTQGDVVDCGGRTLMPGMIDAHIHAYFYDLNMNRLQHLPMTTLAHHAANMLEDILDRGFTTVRDTGGADYGLWMAIQQGLLTSPRLYYCGHALSQNGGHVDMRHQHNHGPTDDHLVLCGCCYANPLGMVVDGVDALRKVVREEFRRGASFIKFTGSGGVSTTADPLEANQFSEDEIRAIVEECQNHLSYVTAHIHPDRALQRAIRLGVHCIEHGTLIEPDTARMAADHGTKIVPTMAVIDALARDGEAFGFPKESLAKLALVKDEAVERMGHMKEAGVHIGFGTDLIGALQPQQCIEFGIRANIFSNFEILQQCTLNNAQILGAEGDIGEIAEGALADIIIVDGNPLESLSCLEEDGAHIPVIMKGGEFHKNELGVAA